MKVSLVKNLFPGMAEGDRSRIQKYTELRDVGVSKTHEGKGCHLVVILVLCIPEKPTALEGRRLQARFLQDTGNAFRNHPNSGQVPSKVGSSGYSACTLSFPSQASQTLCRLGKNEQKQWKKQFHSENKQPDTYVPCVSGRQPGKEIPGQGKEIKT